MNQPPQDIASLKAVLKASVRKAVREYVEACVGLPPGLVGYMVAECWPSQAAVIEAVVNELEARERAGEGT